MTYDQLYTLIDEALGQIINQRYYTVVPYTSIYPHIFVQVISDNPMHHNDSHMPSVIRLQVEVRAVDQATAVQKAELIVNALQSDSNVFFARLQPTPKPLIYDVDARVYRVIQEYLVNYK